MTFPKSPNGGSKRYIDYIREKPEFLEGTEWELENGELKRQSGGFVQGKGWSNMGHISYEMIGEEEGF